MIVTIIESFLIRDIRIKFNYSVSAGKFLNEISASHFMSMSVHTDYAITDLEIIVNHLVEDGKVTEVPESTVAFLKRILFLHKNHGHREVELILALQEKLDNVKTINNP